MFKLAYLTALLNTSSVSADVINIELDGKKMSYLPEAGRGKTLNKFCVDSLGYQIFDYRRLDQHMREPGNAGAFRTEGMKGFFELILCEKQKWKLTDLGYGCEDGKSECKM